MSKTLVGRLFDGPIDVVGDVHGEIRAMMVLLWKLGYDRRGNHPQGRRLVFVGDLGDRGPDSPAVVEWVRDRILEGKAQSVLGNHDFNALWASHGGPMKTELSWLFDESRPFDYRGKRVPQVLVRGRTRDDILSFFDTLPIALERDGELPLRVVHACWEADAIERIRHESDVIALHRRERAQIEKAIHDAAVSDPLDRKLMHQNNNPVKRLTSGTEGRSVEPILINNEPRWERRTAWWPQYDSQPLCVFGHYWRTPLPNEGAEFHLFDGLPRNALCGGSATCVDYSAGKRYKERLQHGFDGTYRTSLAALRLPEGVLYFDNDDPMPLLGPDGRPAFGGAT